MLAINCGPSLSLSRPPPHHRFSLGSRFPSGLVCRCCAPVAVVRVLEVFRCKREPQSSSWTLRRLMEALLWRDNPRNRVSSTSYRGIRALRRSCASLKVTFHSWSALSGPPAEPVRSPSSDLLKCSQTRAINRFPIV